MTETKILKRTVILTLVSSFLIFTGGCAKLGSKIGIGGNIQKLKQGTLKYDRTLTIGQVLESNDNFKNSKWSEFKDEQGRNIVVFNTKPKFQLKDCKKSYFEEDTGSVFLKYLKMNITSECEIHFLMNANGSGFKIGEVGAKIYKNGILVSNYNEFQSNELYIDGFMNSFYSKQDFNEKQKEHGRKLGCLGLMLQYEMMFPILNTQGE